MAKYTVCCFKDYDDLLEFERERWGKTGEETCHQWWFDNGRIEVVKLTLLDDFQPIETIDELCFVNCSVDDCKDEKVLQWYKKMRGRICIYKTNPKILMETLGAEDDEECEEIRIVITIPKNLSNEELKMVEKFKNYIISQGCENVTIEER